MHFNYWRNLILADMQKEIWKDVPGYFGLYQVSNYGQIKSIERNGTKGGVLRNCLRRGYYYVNLSINDKERKCAIHRLVAMAFIPNPDNLPQINHKNEIKTDNRVENLEWCTAKYNANYGTANYRRSKNHHKKSIAQIDKNANVIAVFESISEVERKTKIPRSNIIACIKGRRKSTSNYKWKLI